LDDTSHNPKLDMAPVDLITFDLDGTLVDTRQDIAESVNFALQQLGLQRLSLQQVMQNVGDGVRMLLQRSLPPEHQDELQTAVALFKQHYGEHLLVHSRFYPGVPDMLDHFREKLLAVVSNKPEQFTRRMLDGLSIANRFAAVLGGDSASELKPSPELLLKVLAQVQAQAARAIMVGDSPSDIEAGRAAGMLTCAVSYGYRPRDVLLPAQPDIVIDDIRELKTLLA